MDEVAAIIDWQTAFVGCPMVDVARLIMCCETHVRRQLHCYIAEIYHDELKRATKESENASTDPKLTYTLEDLQTAFELNFVHQAANFAIIFTSVRPMQITELSGPQQCHKGPLVDPL